MTTLSESLGQHLAEVCERKVHYLSEQLATNAAVLITLERVQHGRRAGELHVYRCTVCRDYALTEYAYDPTGGHSGEHR